MMFMNEWEIEEAIGCAERLDNPNQIKAAGTLAQLANWTNANSDGWAYWPKPLRAATRLMQALKQMETDERATWQRGGEVDDFTDDQVKTLLAPIRTFLDRRGVDWRTVLTLATPTYADAAQPALF